MPQSKTKSPAFFPVKMDNPFPDRFITTSFPSCSVPVSTAYTPFNDSRTVRETGSVPAIRPPSENCGTAMPGSCEHRRRQEAGTKKQNV
jgi:hypothetical protein